MDLNLDKTEIGRGFELYLASKYLENLAKKGEIRLMITKEPLQRRRKEVKNIVATMGSFDPFTRAHEALFLKGLNYVKEKHQDENAELLIATSVNHINKGVDFSSNSAIPDRVHALEGFASAWQQVSLGFFNNPFIVNLLPNIEKEYNSDINIYFLAGVDVMEKIANPKSYQNSQLSQAEVLGNIFEKHNIIVCERTVKENGHSELLGLENIMDNYPILEQYKEKLFSIDLGNDYPELEIPIEDVSSTVVRKNKKLGKPIQKLTGVGISDYVDKRGLYLSDTTFYYAMVAARSRFVFENQNQPIGNYLSQFMLHLSNLNEDLQLRSKEIKNYESNKEQFENLSF